MITWGKGFNYYGGVRMEPYYDRLGFANSRACRIGAKSA